MKPQPERKEPIEIKKVPVEKKSVLDFFASKPKDSPKPAQTVMQFGSWVFPPLDLLRIIQKKNTIDKDFIERQSLEIQKTLLEFNIKVTMDNYTA